MVASLYIKTYYEWLADRFAKEGITFDKTLFYVPNNSPEAMIEYLVRHELVNRSKSPGEQVAFMGFNRGVINKSEGVRGNHALRARGDIVSSRKMMRTGFELTTFVVTNHANLAEDIEEIYNVCIREISTFPVDMEPIYEADYPNFSINVEHSDVTDVTPVPEKGNLWGMASLARLAGPAFSLNQDEKAKAKKLSVLVYQHNVTQPKAKIESIKEDGY